MTGAMFRAMWLSLANDRGALTMAFILPVFFFLVMAEIFSASSGVGMQLRVAFVDEVQDELSIRLIDALKSGGTIDVVESPGMDRLKVMELVGQGTADVGLVVREGGRSLDDVAGFGPAPLVVVNDPIRGVTVPVLSGQIQKAYFEALPDVALGSVTSLLEDQFIEFSEEQRAELDEGFAEMGEAAQAGSDIGWSFGQLIEAEEVAGRNASTNHIAYYAGAVAFMFLMFTTMTAAISLTEERETGILDRILAGPGGMAVLVNGKFLFLMVQGFVQMSIIFATAWIVYDIDVPAHLTEWVVITLCACITASGVGLFSAALCRTPAQARNLSTIVVVIISVIGGSMVPRFFMPVWLRDLGWFTPNTWVLEAYSAVFWRGEGLSEVLLPCGLLVVLGLTSLLASQWVAVKRATI